MSRENMEPTDTEMPSAESGPGDSGSGSSDIGTRNFIRRILTRQSPFAEPIDGSSEEIIDYLLNECKILVIGAGGLGCELLKDLALMGIRTHDIGRPKAVVAAEFVARIVPDCKLVAHHNKIQDFPPDFYNKFNIVICGLDSIEARRWINNMMVDLLVYDSEGNLDQSTVIPLIDGGTEGLKGNARVILPGLTACIECNLDLYPPPVNYPLCTIANTPRLPEHCIEYAKVLLWPKEHPFGTQVSLDSDNSAHIQWIHERAIQRARQYSIDPPTLRFTQSVVKRTIAAVSSTNACIAATCAMEAFKLITSSAKPMNNFHMLNLSSGVYTYVFEAEKKDECLVCSKQLSANPKPAADPAPSASTAPAAAAAMA